MVANIWPRGSATCKRMAHVLLRGTLFVQDGSDHLRHLIRVSLEKVIIQRLFTHSIFPFQEEKNDEFYCINSSSSRERSF